MPRALELSGRPLTATSRDKPLFVNRVEEAAAVNESVAAGINVLVLGERGSGKTSLLRSLSRGLEEGGWRAVFVEGSLAKSPVELLTLIRARVSPSIVVPGVGEQLVASVQALQALGGPRTFPRRPEGSAGESELLLDLVSSLGADLRNDKRRHVVIIDEVSSPEIVHTVFGRLRDEIWQLPIVWVVAGAVKDRLSYLRPPADAFFSRLITLEPFDEKMAMRLLRARIPRVQASDGLLRAIVAESSRFPRDLVRAASDVVVRGAHPEQLAISREKRERALDSLGEPAKRVVAELEANGPASASDENFLARLGFGRSRAAQIFRELERLGIVEASVDHPPGGRQRKMYGLRNVGE